MWPQGLRRYWSTSVLKASSMWLWGSHDPWCMKTLQRGLFELTHISGSDPSPTLGKPSKHMGSLWCTTLCIRLIGGRRKSHSHCNLAWERILKTPSNITIIFIINIILILKAFLQKVKHGIPFLHIIFLSWEGALLSLEGDTMESNLNWFCSDHLC